MKIKNWRAIPSAVRWRLVLAVYRAEILSVLRDRWTVVVSVLIPVLLYPTAGVGLSSALTQTFGKLEAEVSDVCLSGAPDDVAAIAIAFGKEKPPITRVVAVGGRLFQ